MGTVDLCEDELFDFHLHGCCNRNIIVTADLLPSLMRFQLSFADFRTYSSCNLHLDIRK